MSPQEIPRTNRTGEGVDHTRNMLPIVSMAMGRVMNTKVRGRGSLRGQVVSQGKRQLPTKNPRYMPRQRAHTAMGWPNICRQRESI